MSLLNIKFTAASTGQESEQFMDLEDARLEPKFLMQQVDFAAKDMLPDATSVKGYFFEATGESRELTECSAPAALNLAEGCLPILLVAAEDCSASAVAAEPASGAAVQPPLPPPASTAQPAAGVAASPVRRRIAVEVRLLLGPKPVTMADSLDLKAVEADPRELHKLAAEFGRRLCPAADSDLALLYEDEDGDRCTLTEDTADDALAQVLARSDFRLQLTAEARPAARRPEASGAPAAAVAAAADGSKKAEVESAAAAAAAEPAAELPAVLAQPVQVTHVFRRQKPRSAVAAAASEPAAALAPQPVAQQAEALAESRRRSVELEAKVSEQDSVLLDREAALLDRDYRLELLAEQLEELQTTARINARRAEDCLQASSAKEQELDELKAGIQQKQEDLEFLGCRLGEVETRAADAASRTQAELAKARAEVQQAADSEAVLQERLEVAEGREAELQARLKEAEGLKDQVKYLLDEVGEAKKQAAAADLDMSEESHRATELERQLAERDQVIETLREDVRGVAAGFQKSAEKKIVVINDLQVRLKQAEEELERRAALDEVIAGLRSELAARTAELDASRAAAARNPRLSAKVLSSEPDMAGVEMDGTEEPGASGDISGEQLPLMERLGAHQAFRVGRATVSIDQDDCPIVYAVTVQNDGQDPWPGTTMLVHHSGPALGMPLLELGPVQQGNASTVYMELLLPKALEVCRRPSTWVLRDVATGRPLGPVLVFEVEYTKGDW